MDRTPIIFEPITRWRTVLRHVAGIVLYILALAVIVAPTIILALVGSQ